MTQTVTTATEHRIGVLEELPVGEGRAYALDGTQVAVFHLRDGRVRAVSAVCPHRGGPIADGQADLHVVLCPLHQHAFDLDDGSCRTGQPPLRSFPVRVDEAGGVYVTLEQ